MRRLKRIWNQLHIQEKITLLYVVLSIIPIIIITMTAYMIYSRNLEKQTEQLTSDNLLQSTGILASDIDDQRSFVYTLMVDKELLTYAKRINEVREEAINKNYMYDLFTQYANSRENIRFTVFLNRDNSFVTFEKDNFVTEESYFYNPELRRKLYNQVMDQGKLTYISTQLVNEHIIDKDYMYILGVPLNDYISKENLGVLLVGVDKDTLKMYTTQESPMEIRRYDKGIVIDDENNIVFHQDDSYIGKSLESLYELYDIKDISIESKQIPNTPWTMVSIIDKGVLNESIRTYRTWVFIISIVIIGIFMLVMQYITRRYSKSIKEIAGGMNLFGKGNMDVQIEYDEHDELYVIADQFNKMTKEINQLVQENNEKNDAILKAEYQKKRSEIKALEAQLNPHFIYNALDMINWRAIDQDEDEISEMLSSLGKLLRYSISNIDMIVLLRAEVEWLKKYIYIQRRRFDYSFDFECYVSEEAMEYPIYKMLLQPAIENSILHGFLGIKEGGILKFEAYVDIQEQLHIIVSDNGHGIEEDMLKWIRRYIRGEEESMGNHIGMTNFIDRIRLYYEGKASIEVDYLTSLQENYGTKIHVIIPEQTV